MRYIDYTDPYDIEYACFLLAKPPPIPQVLCFKLLDNPFIKLVLVARNYLSFKY